MIIPAVREDMRGFRAVSIPGWNVTECAWRKEAGSIPAPSTNNKHIIMDFGNDIPDYDPDDFDNYDYEWHFSKPVIILRGDNVHIRYPSDNFYCINLDRRQVQMRNIESQTQQACVRYFRLQYPRYAGCFFSVPNGGRRDTVTGAILKAEGALAGVADLFLSVPNNVHHGLYVEMKTRKGRQQDSQKAFQKAVEAQGYRYEICRSLDDFIALIKDYLNG